MVHLQISDQALADRRDLLDLVSTAQGPVGLEDAAADPALVLVAAAGVVVAAVAEAVAAAAAEVVVAAGGAAAGGAVRVVPVGVAAADPVAVADPVGLAAVARWAEVWAEVSTTPLIQL